MNTTSNKYSDLKIAWFSDKLQSIRQRIVTAPIYVRLKPTNRCCHKCTFCAYNVEQSSMHDTMRLADELPREKVLEILSDFKDMGVKCTTYSGGGEPLMHPNIVEFFETTVNYGIDLSVITNGQFLNGERARGLINAKWVRVSMNYHEASMFKKSRGGSEKAFKQILSNIKGFGKIKSTTCDLAVNFILTKENHNSVFEATLMLKELGVNNVRFSPVWTKDFVAYHAQIKQQVVTALTKARDLFQSDSFKVYDSYKITEEVDIRKYKKCYIVQIIPVVGADGFVYNCHNKSYTREGIVGSIKDKSFKEVWFSEKAKKHFEEFDPQQSCRCQCANDNKNLFINELLDCYGDNYV